MKRKKIGHDTAYLLFFTKPSAEVEVSYISPLINEINDMLQKTAASGKYAAVLIKTVGICGLCRFTSGSCRDMGENGLAAKVEFASKAAVAVMSLPLVEEIITTSLKLLGEQM